MTLALDGLGAGDVACPSHSAAAWEVASCPPVIPSFAVCAFPWLECRVSLVFRWSHQLAGPIAYLIFTVVDHLIPH